MTLKEAEDAYLGAGIFLAGEKSVEIKRIFPNVGVNPEFGRRARVKRLVPGAEGKGDGISDSAAARDHDGSTVLDLEKFSVQISNHFFRFLRFKIYRA